MRKHTRALLAIAAAFAFSASAPFAVRAADGAAEAAFKEYCQTYQQDQEKQRTICGEYWATPEYAAFYEKTYGSEASSLESATVSLGQENDGIVGEHIRNFDTAVKVLPDGSARVTESISYDFSVLYKHGIYRDIPVDYRASDGSKWSFRLSDISVADDRGAPYPFTDSSYGKYRRIKIGDPNQTITGIHTYVIAYTVDRPIGYFQDFDEIYWNATGNEWQVPIGKASATVILPQAVDASVLRTSCYYGPAGSSARCDDSLAIQGDSVSFKAPGMLGAGEGLTVAVGFPKGIVAAPTAAENAGRAASDLLSSGILWLLMPAIVAIFMYMRWSKKGRDPKGSGVIIAQYEAPDGLSPAQTRFIATQDFINALPAEIVWLAAHGYIRIKRIPSKGVFSSEDYELSRIKGEDADLKEFQAILMRRLFAGGGDTVLLSSLKYKFADEAREVNASALDAIVKDGYYPDAKSAGYTPSSAKGGGQAIGSRKIAFMTSALFAIIFVGSSLGNALGGYFVLAWIMTVAAFTVFAYLMPRMTEKGVSAKERALGLKLYMSVAEKDRLSFHNAPAKDPQTFERLLPYAIAFAVVKEWSKAFEGIDLGQPSWYSDSSMSSFNAGLFASNMTAFSHAATQTLAPAPGSSSGSGGGGFSGGGGGGGGGGSW